MSYSIGFDIGGTNIKYAAVDEHGVVLKKDAIRTASSRKPYEYWRDNLAHIIRCITASYGEHCGVGIAAPGLVAEDRRSVAWMKGRMETIEGIDWTSAMDSTRPIEVINDAQAALMAEVWCGAAAGCMNAALLTLGTGVGGACLVDGHILRGTIGRAGHLGHICLDPNGPMDIVNTPGSLEDAIGECTLYKRSGFNSTIKLLQAAQAGDSHATAVWERSLHFLACGMISIINVVDPAVFIIGGGIAHSGDALFKPLQALMDKYEWRPTGRKVVVAPAALGEFAGAIGAAKITK